MRGSSCWGFYVPGTQSQVARSWGRAAPSLPILPWTETDWSGRGGSGGGGRWRRRGLRRGLWEGLRGLGSSLQRSRWPRGELERGPERGASGAAKASGGSSGGMSKAMGAQEQRVRMAQRLKKIRGEGHVEGRGSGRALAWEREGLGQVMRDLLASDEFSGPSS